MQSRYYNPTIGRFINADGLAYLGVDGTPLSYNLFAYCKNNPVCTADPTGEFGLITGLLIGAAIGIFSQYLGGVVSNVIEGEQGADVFKTDNTIADYAGAALSGMVAATGIGLFGAVLANVGISSATYLANCGIKNEAVTPEGFGWSVATGMISGFIGGSGVDVGGKGAVFDVASDVIANSKSLTKVVMYTAKKTAIKTGLAVGTLRTIGSILVPNALSAGKEVLFG